MENKTATPITTRPKTPHIGLAQAVITSTNEARQKPTRAQKGKWVPKQQNSMTVCTKWRRIESKSILEYQTPNQIVEGHQEQKLCDSIKERALKLQVKLFGMSYYKLLHPGSQPDEFYPVDKCEFCHLQN